MNPEAEGLPMRSDRGRVEFDQMLTNELWMRKNCAKMVPKNRFARSKGHQEGKVSWHFGFNWKTSPLSGTDVITGDESWVFQYVPDYGVAHFNLSKPKKARMSKSEIKSMLICFLFWLARKSSTNSLCLVSCWLTIQSTNTFTERFLKAYYNYSCETKHQLGVAPR